MNKRNDLNIAEIVNKDEGLMADLSKMAMIADMSCFDMATNLTIIGVESKMCENAEKKKGLPLAYSFLLSP